MIKKVIDWSAVIVFFMIAALLLVFLMSRNIRQTFKKNFINLNESVLFELVQGVRGNLKPYTKSEKLCDMAELRVEEVLLESANEDISHAGFSKMYQEKGNQGFTQLSENLVCSFNEKMALNQWFNSKSHRNAIFTEYPYTCLKCKADCCVQIFAK